MIQRYARWPQNTAIRTRSSRRTGYLVSPASPALARTSSTLGIRMNGNIEPVEIEHSGILTPGNCRSAGVGYPMRLERQRDNQQWLLDYLVKVTGRVQNFFDDGRTVPVEVKSYAMI